MARRSAVVIAALFVAACSGGSGATPVPTLGPGGGSVAPGSTAGPATLAPVSAAPTQQGGGGATATLKPSGAKLRIANLYRDANGKGTDLDVYGDYDATSAPKLIAVPYGTVTEFFDPGVLDDQGDANWTFYAAGKTGQDDQIGQQQETLTGTERITMAIASGDNKSPNGTLLGRWKTTFETSTDFPLPTAPTANDAVLMVDGVALSAMPGSTETFAWVGVDGICLPPLDADASNGAQPWGPQSQQVYRFPAGSHGVSVQFAGANGAPDCKAKSPYDPLTVDLKAGTRAFLFYYTPDDKTLKGLLIPAP